MILRMRIVHGLVLASLAGTLVACSLSAVDRGTRIRIAIDAGGMNGRAVGRPVPLVGASPPVAVTSFDCIGVNVSGPGIPDTGRNPEPNLGPLFDRLSRGESYCSYRGILAGPLSPNGGLQEISLAVPPGGVRLVQLIGLKERNGSNDCQREFNPALPPVVGPSGVPVEAAAYELGRFLGPLVQDATITIPVSWDSLSAADQAFRSVKCHDVDPNPSPSVGVFVFNTGMTTGHSEPAVFYDTRSNPPKLHVSDGTGGETYDFGTGTWTAHANSPGTGAGGVLLPYSSGGLMAAGGVGAANLSNTATGLTWSLTPGNLSSSVAIARSSPVTVGGAMWFFGAASGSASISRILLSDNSSTYYTNLSVGRSQAATALLTNGKIIVAGGNYGSGSSPACDLWDPTGPALSACVNMPVGASGAVAVPLTGGDAFVVGGASGGGSGTPSAMTQLYSAGANTWTGGASLPEPRADAAVARLTDGRVFVIGGRTTGDAALASTLFFTGTAWVAGPPLNVARASATATVTPDGRVFVVGGKDSVGASISSVEIWIP